MKSIYQGCFGYRLIRDELRNSENIFGIMEPESILHKEYESVEHCKLELEKYIEYYNHKRIKAKFKGMCPAIPGSCPTPSLPI